MWRGEFLDKNMTNRRTIKFRVWDNLKKEWVSNTNIWRMKTDVNGIGEINPNTFYWKQHPDGLTYQQYTGLVDKNGVEIYEGDILRHDIGLGPIYYEVFWSETNGAWMIDKNHGGDCGCWFDNYEIAGNIFENPELLES